MSKGHRILERGRQGVMVPGTDSQGYVAGEKGQVSLLIRRNMELEDRESDSKKLTCFFIVTHRPQGTVLIPESETVEKEIRARCP